MKPGTLIILSLLLGFNSLCAQNCNCLEQFDFVVKYYENNNPAFQNIKSDQKELVNYTKAVRTIRQDASKESNSDLCNKYFNQYLKLLKDHHSSIDLNLQRVADLLSVEKIDSFKSSAIYKSFGKRDIDTLKVIKAVEDKPVNDIEGIYYSPGNIKIAILKTKANQYEGIVIRKNKLLDIGHVLLEIALNKDSSYSCVYNVGILGFNFKMAYFDDIKQINGCLPMLGFCKSNNVQETDELVFEALNDDCYYLKIKSFSYNLKPVFDSLYKEIVPLISQRKYLIIDLRDNGGGSEGNYFDLLKVVYTKPMMIDEAEVWVTPDNIVAYENYQSKDEELIARMKNATQFTFIKQKEEPLTKLELATSHYPEKVIVLQNKFTGSAAEGFISYALQSDKVITMGENTGGFIGYGNVMTVDVPCGKFKLNSTTTRYKNNYQYEFVGVPPMLRISGYSDWISNALKTLHNPPK